MFLIFANFVKNILISNVTKTLFKRKGAKLNLKKIAVSLSRKKIKDFQSKLCVLKTLLLEKEICVFALKIIFLKIVKIDLKHFFCD